MFIHFSSIFYSKTVVTPKLSAWQLATSRAWQFIGIRFWVHAVSVSSVLLTYYVSYESKKWLTSVTKPLGKKKKTKRLATCVQIFRPRTGSLIGVYWALWPQRCYVYLCMLCTALLITPPHRRGRRWRDPSGRGHDLWPKECSDPNGYSTWSRLPLVHTRAHQHKAPYHMITHQKSGGFEVDRVISANLFWLPIIPISRIHHIT